MSLDRSSQNRLTEKMLPRFTGDTLFDRIARAVCRAGCLPRKELYEAWETAKRVRRKYRGGRVVDLACGHGLLAHILLLLDGSSPEAVACDLKIPDNAEKLSASILERWPGLKGRISYVKKPLQEIGIYPDDLVVCVHGCGSLTDLVIDRAVSAGARLAVLPCCHNVSESDTGGLEGWIDGPLAVDVTRAAKLRMAGYFVMTGKIPEDITPKNRLLMAHRGQMKFSKQTAAETVRILSP